MPLDSVDALRFECLLILRTTSEPAKQPDEISELNQRPKLHLFMEEDLPLVSGNAAAKFVEEIEMQNHFVDFRFLGAL